MAVSFVVVEVKQKSKTLLDLDVVKSAKLLDRKKELIDTVVPVNKHDLHENVVRRKHCPKVHTQ